MKIEDLELGDRFAAIFGGSVLEWTVEAIDGEHVLGCSGYNLRELWNEKDLVQRRAIKLQPSAPSVDSGGLFLNSFNARNE